jgi:lysine-specific demethylase 8
MSELPVTPVPRVPAPPPDVFEREYVNRSRPVILTGMIDGWPARGRWSPEYLRESYGDARVSVTMDPRRGLLHEEMSLGAYLDALLSGAPSGYLMSRLDELPAALRREAPEPPYCSNAPWRVSKLWVSEADTVSAMHRDLADNLHAVVTGGKRFTLLSPEDDGCVYPNGLFSSVPNGCQIDVERPDFERFPRLRRARPQVAELAPGDTLFIPGDWWHHVRSLARSVTVNFWWARGARASIATAADLFKRLRGISR